MALIATLVVVAWSVYPVFRLQYEHRRELESLESELGGLKERNEQLRDEVEGLKTPEGVEALARASLGLVRPGEQAYIVTGGSSSEASAAAPPSEASGDPLWQRALDSLFGLD